MSPLALRRYRADRLLREEFQTMRARVLRAVGRRLRARGIDLDGSDLEGCYATAWQGLHAAMIDGQQIESPFGWLVLVTFRRAVEECRSCHVHTSELVGVTGTAAGSRDPDSCVSPAARDLAGELDDRMRLVQLFEGLHARLSDRERQAATLCYLQGLSRAEAAARMGISQGRMRKLMEGRGATDPGVCGKLGALAATIDSGRWCESQGSLMRALAYGMLDPEGERYRLALMHHGHCPACRAYVLSLRGLAIALPPVLAPWGPLAAVIGGPRAAAHLRTLARHGAPPGVAGTGAGGYVSGTSGAAGGEWLLSGGGLSAKLAVSCLLALGVGGGCVALQAGPRHHRGGVVLLRRSPPAPAARAGVSAAVQEAHARLTAVLQRPYAPAAKGGGAPVTVLARSARAQREFGPEQALLSVGEGEARSRQSTSGGPVPGRVGVARVSSIRPPAPAEPGPAPPEAQARAAQREFAPG